MLPLLQNAHRHPDRPAIISNGRRYTYRELLAASEATALALLDGRADLGKARIAFLVAPGFDYVRTQWGIWRAGGIAVPLSDKHPYASIRYIVEDTGAEAVVFSRAYEARLQPLFDEFPIRTMPVEGVMGRAGELPEVASGRRAMILYTSGTTGRPKGVVSTHRNIEAQIRMLVTAWAWSADDHILNVLPMHHVHGIVNILSCALWSGACCEFLPKFEAEAVFDVFRRGEVNLFMAVPTIYHKLIAYWEELPAAEQAEISDALRRFRLMVSGSAALPVSTLDKWRRISGHTLLERYGMTEMGMAISNPYRGERRPGHIGRPLPGVAVRLVDDHDHPVAEGTPGEIQVKGPNVFHEYWNRPEATRAAFVDGWFRTGDIAALEDGSYRILGRNSVDIIKSGGYKISALEIEEVLRRHPDIADCGVVGIPDEEWGELIAAGLVLAGGKTTAPDLNEWLHDKLPRYQLPRKYGVLDDLPRNAMGKVTKKELQKILSAL